MINKHTIISALNLTKHIEGGYFKRTYQSSAEVNERPLLTSIYYLLTDEAPIGHFHKNKSDILHCYHLGDPMTYLTISPVGELDTFILGSDILNGHVLQKVVPGGYWKASCLKQGSFGLLSEAVSPGFDYRDMQLATASELHAEFPLLWDKISAYVK